MNEWLSQEITMLSNKTMNTATDIVNYEFHKKQTNTNIEMHQSHDSYPEIAAHVEQLYPGRG